ncbi:GNAT family N-acetyltransferase [Yoonia sp. R2-816]|uniref:GNAT family N-acetyltransferase n=1 Tax=Yoonia sp. R2-816 TaxID=3342638 RepID=UPI0037279DD6
MLIALKEMTAENRRILEQMFQYYLYDMSEFTGWSLSEDGSFSYPTDLLTPYWQEQDHYPYFIICNDEVAGFCLLRRLSADRIIWDMGQFFVLRKFRRHKLGEMAFEKAITLHTGQWQVRVLIANKPAYQFWKRSVTVVSKGNFAETVGSYLGAKMTYFTFRSEP